MCIGGHIIIVYILSLSKVCFWCFIYHPITLLVSITIDWQTICDYLVNRIKFYDTERAVGINNKPAKPPHARLFKLLPELRFGFIKLYFLLFTKYYFCSTRIIYKIKYSPVREHFSLDSTFPRRGDSSNNVVSFHLEVQYLRVVCQCVR